MKRWDDTLAQMGIEAQLHLTDLKQQQSSLLPGQEDERTRKAEIDEKRLATIRFREFVRKRRVHVGQLRRSFAPTPVPVVRQSTPVPVVQKRSNIGKGYRMALYDLTMLTQTYGLPVEDALALLTDYSEQVMRVWENDSSLSNDAKAPFMAFVGAWLRDRRQA